MPTVRAIIVDALSEIGVMQPGESLTAADGAIGLLRFQHQLDAWAADGLTLSRQLRTTFTLPAGTSTVSVGTGQTVNITRPMFLNSVSYVVPASSPGVEVPIGILDEDAYASITIKDLSSSYPLQCFYQTNISDAYGSLFFWPVVSGDVTIALYTPQAVDVPASLDTVMVGPAGYQEAFMYQLALRLCGPYGKVVSADLQRMEARATRTMQRPNVSPGVLGVDAALVPGLGSGYNVLTDTSAFSNSR